MASDGTYALRVDRVTKRYGDHLAVADLSFEVAPGVIYGVLGPNGAGKSTTLRMINDILAPDQGEIHLLDGLRPGRAAAPHIGYLPEERGLYPKMRVLDTLQFFGELRGLAGREARRRGLDWLERLDIGGWKDNRVQDLSKGMQQKVQFATALLHEPPLLILDEPWSGLDPINADVLRDIVVEQKRAGRTILFSTHLMEQAEQVCDQVCIIARGRKVLDGALQAIKAEAAADRLVAVAFAGPDEQARARAEVLGDAALVAGLRERRDHLEIELGEGAAAEALLARLVAAGLAVRRFHPVEPSLHQIFVDRVGAGHAGAAEHGGGDHDAGGRT
jgi:ABC-2 type transport system ATP-binding protein